MEDTFLEDDTYANAQLTAKFFLKYQYIFVINFMNKKYDHIIFIAIRETKAYEPYFNEFNNFSLTFNFLTPKECDLHCSHQIMLRTKQTHANTHYKFIQHHYTTNTPSRYSQHQFLFVNSKYTSPFFLN